MQNLAGLVLAAGSSSRLGRPKQVVSYRSRTLVERAASLAADFCGAGVIVVTGAHHEQVVAALDGSPAEVIHNPDWARGMSTSVRAGLGRAKPGCDVLLLLCDQPRIRRDDLQSLVDAWTTNPERIATAEYTGTYGVPAIFPADYRDTLLSLTGDQGAKGIIAGARQVSVVAMPNAGFDIDTPDDLDRLGE